MREEIAEQQRDLKEHEARQPDRGGAPQGWEELFGGHRLHQKEEECAEKDGGAVKKAGCGHVRTRMKAWIGRMRGSC